MINQNTSFEVRHFQAASVDDAMRVIRDEWGHQAAIVQSRTVWNGWLRGLLGARRVEITAVRAPARQSSSAQQGETPPRETPPAHLENFRERFRRDLTERKATPHPEHLDASAPNQVDLQLFAQLVDRHIDADTAHDILCGLRDLLSGADSVDCEQGRQKLRDQLASSLVTRPGIELEQGQRKVVGFVGPTGVGKTTTIAKIAANFRLREKRTVGLVTTDTYRIAAIDQLRTYAEIIDLPLEVAATPREMRQAVTRLSDCDLVLVDTGGRNPRSALQLRELKSLLQEARADDMVLVLSATWGAKLLEQSAERFADMGCSSLILTKLDEADGPGTAWPFLRRSSHTLRYFTNGQSVPEDIVDADSHRLVDLLLNEPEPGVRS